MMILGIEPFFAVVDAYKAATGLPDKTISSRVLKDSSRIELLRAGGDIGVRKVDSALRWFSDNWPPTATWPREVPRPDPATQGAEGAETAGTKSGDAMWNAGDNSTKACGAGETVIPEVATG